MNQRNLERTAFLILLVIVSVAFALLLQGFVIALFWAVAFAILFDPLAMALKQRIGQRHGLVAVLTVLIVMLAVVIPVMGLGIAVIGETARYIELVDSREIHFRELNSLVVDVVPAEWLKIAATYGFELSKINETLSSIALVSGQWVASNAVRAGQGTLNFALSLFLMVYLLYFFLRDGPIIIERLVQVLPLGDARERALFSRFAQVVRATVKGTFIIGAVQGLIGGVTFALLGIDGAILWGVLMALLSLLPAIGAALVWVPAAIMLFVGEQYIDGGILVFVGVFVIGLSDNLLRPLLVGRDTRMPDYLILLATLGGLGSFGMSGLVIGPLIAALFITLWEMFEASFMGADPDGEFVLDGFGDEVVDDGGGAIDPGDSPVNSALAAAGLGAGATAAALPRSQSSDDELPDPGLDDEFFDDEEPV